MGCEIFFKESIQCAFKKVFAHSVHGNLGFMGQIMKPSTVLLEHLYTN